MRTHLIRRPARDVIPPRGGARSILLSHLILNGRHTVAAHLVHLNSLPSVQMRCIMSPQREMAPGRSRSPDWSIAGVNPNTAPTDFDFRKRAGTSTVAR